MRPAYPAPWASLGLYDRDEAFDTYCAPAAARLPHQVAGKWPDTRRWPHVMFRGRVPFEKVTRIHGQSLATVLLLPDRYAATAQMTQRLFEAVLAGCLPLAPATIARVADFVPEPLIVGTGEDVISAAHGLHALMGSPAHEELIAACLAKLETFRLSRQVKVLNTLLATLPKHADRGLR